MKILTVQQSDTKVTITILSMGRRLTVEGDTKEQVAKKAMKIDDYNTRDHEILEDLNNVLQEQECLV